MSEKAWEPRYRREAYIKARRILDEINEHRRKLTDEQYITLKRLALSGNIDGTVKMLAKLTRG